MKNINNFQALQKNELSKVNGGSNNKFWTWAGYTYENWRISSRRAFNLRQRKNTMTHH